MNIQQWLLARREGRLAAAPLGLFVAAGASGDNNRLSNAFGNGEAYIQNVPMNFTRTMDDRGHGTGYGGGNLIGDGYGHGSCLEINGNGFGNGTMNHDGVSTGPSQIIRHIEVIFYES